MIFCQILAILGPAPFKMPRFWGRPPPQLKNFAATDLWKSGDKLSRRNAETEVEIAGRLDEVALVPRGQLPVAFIQQQFHPQESVAPHPTQNLR